MSCALNIAKSFSVLPCHAITYPDFPFEDKQGAPLTFWDMTPNAGWRRAPLTYEVYMEICERKGQRLPNQICLFLNAVDTGA